MTDAEWEVIEPLLPAPDWLAGRSGRRAKHCRREIVDAILYVVDNGITWRALPANFPPWSTVYNYFADWAQEEVTLNLLDALRDRARLAEVPHAAPSAGIIDSASVKAVETVDADTRGFDAGKKIKGRKLDRSRIAHYKAPREIELVDASPKTATGKVQKFELRHQERVGTNT